MLQLVQLTCITKDTYYTLNECEYNLNYCFYHDECEYNLNYCYDHDECEYKLNYCYYPDECEYKWANLTTVHAR